MTFGGSTSLFKAVGTMKSKSVGIPYSGSKISSNEQVSVPRSVIGSIQCRPWMNIYLKVQGHLSLLPCIGDRRRQGSLVCNLWCIFQWNRSQG